MPFNSGGEVTAALMGGHIDAGVMNPNEIVAQVEAGKAKNLAVAAQKRMTGAPDVPTFAEKGYPFYWEQMRGVVGPAGMAPEAVAWWQDTLKKVIATKKWQDDYIKVNLLTPTDVDRRGSEQVPRRHHRQLREGARRSRRPEEVARAGDSTCAALTGSPAPPCWRWPSRSAPAR